MARTKDEAFWGGAGTGALGGAGTGATIGSAFMPGLGTAIGAGLGAIGGGLLGGFQASGEQSAAEQARAEAKQAQQEELNRQEGLRQQALGFYQNVPDYAYSNITASQMGPTSFEAIREDPRFKDYQMKALEGLYGRAQEGIRPEEMANFRQAQLANAQQLGAQQRAQQLWAQQRGVGTSGMGMAQQIAQQQGAANRNYEAGLGMQQQAGQRALSALQGYGGMVGQVRGQEYGMAANKASAADAISRYNAENQNRISMFNAEQAANAARIRLQKAQGQASAVFGAGTPSKQAADYTDYNAQREANKYLQSAIAITGQTAEKLHKAGAFNFSEEAPALPPGM